jgi:hypothetical protein
MVAAKALPPPPFAALLNAAKTRSIHIGGVVSYDLRTYRHHFSEFLWRKDMSTQGLDICFVEEGHVHAFPDALFV